MSTIAQTATHESTFRPLTFRSLPENPLVSVLMSSYNRRDFIGEAIESVLSQSYAHWELVICDDGSTDGSAEVVRGYQRRDARVQLIEKPNGGQSSGFNAAYLKSSGQVICLLDSDDLDLERKIECVVKTFQRVPEAGMVAHPVYRVDVRRRRYGTLPLLSGVPSGWFGDEMLRTGGILDRLPPGLGLAIRREVAERIFPLREHGPLRNYGDAPIMRLAPLICRIQGLEEPLAEWRQHESNHGNLRHLTEEFMTRELCCYAALWEQQREYLVTYHPQLAGRLAPLETHVHVAEMRYAQARLGGSGEVNRAHRALMEKLRAARCSPVRRFFWGLSAWLPGWLFSRILDAVATQTRLKQWLAKVKRVQVEVRRLPRRWFTAGGSPEEL